MTKILSAANPASSTTVKTTRIYSHNDQLDADSQILTPQELEDSKYINAEFWKAEVQVPNEIYKITDANGFDRIEQFTNNDEPKFEFFDMVRVSIQEPGTGAMLITDHYVTPFHVKRWPDRWEAYKQGQTKGVDGTAIDYLTSIPASAHANLKSVGIFTIEQLARAASAGSLIANGNRYQEAVRAYLEKNQAAPTVELENEVAELKAQLAELLAATKKTSTKQ